MTPLFMIRMWLRRAPLQSRIGAGVAVLVAVGVLAWIAVPGSSPSNLVSSGPSFTPGGSTGGPSANPPEGATTQSNTAANSTAPAVGAFSSSGSPQTSSPSPASGTTGSTGASSVPTSGSGTAGSALGSTGSATTSCQKAASPIKIGVIMPDVGSGSSSLNSFLGVPPVSQIQADYAAVFDYVDKHGGVQCHPLTGDYQAFNELDSSSTQTICLKFAQDGVYAALGGFGPLSPDTCLLQNKIPTIEQIMISEADAKKYYPYYFSANGAYELAVRNFVYAVARMGYFGPAKHFKKLGVLLRTCEPSEQPTLMSALAANGVTGSQVDTFNFGCNSAALADPPNEISQAELQFANDGVTVVTAVDDSTDLQGFTNDANSQSSLQHWKPYYAIPDDGAFATLSATQNVPNSNQFDGAVGITGLQYGGQAAGLPESDATKQCDAIMTSHHLPTVYQSGDNFAGNACDTIFMLAGAMRTDVGLAQSGLAAAITRAGTVNMSYPDGPNDFSKPGVTWGGDFWREDLFYASCRCFKTVMPQFQKSF